MSTGAVHAVDRRPRLRPRPRRGGWGVSARQVDTELLRGISLQRALWHGGALFRQSPVDLPDGRRMGLWERGRPGFCVDICM